MLLSATAGSRVLAAGGSPQVAVQTVMLIFTAATLNSRAMLYREGEPADTVDLVAVGTLSIAIAQGDGGSLLMRRIKTQTVVGEMGFFRQSPRSATVSSDGPATLYTVTRINFEKMRRERPDLASAFDDFILRILADRIEFANCQVQPEPVSMEIRK